ncbi:Ankyrin repeat-rich membrane spanning protein [Bacillus cereus]|uniref:Ankyrin repeat-containing protein n=1 Tax=Bacillus wiedmannii TaxID=1890302 RepID=A0A1C4F338_9BACI|nr:MULTISPECIES: ankyrin repeat domain-containing protein [Bacillus]SCC50340.1 Ankyrin repeat-rich membrane spanning protein [Bacillus cereus]KAA0775616.1 ankyrin repeat domain-containing protein [Bacillus sp. BB51/4]KMP29258.1 ankyrin [Bacillus wiedmannii]MBZ4224032.1 ankyrin repeat domain-containing protein [Bacillus wiedmannii]MDI6678124.1 ankyrin repeat domain-containing protein [Bacillus wiedmannii]
MKSREKAIKIYDLIGDGDIEQAKEIIITDKSLLDFVTPFGTWLHVSARAGELDMIKFLVESGMDINRNEGVPKSAPIAHAASEGEMGIVEYLFDNGAILDVSDPNRNPLFSAIYGGHFNIVKYLVQSGIDITVKYTGDTMKDMGAYEFAIERGKVEIAEYLKMYT